MFVNLCNQPELAEEFRQFNFDASTGTLRTVPSPAGDVEVAFRLKPGFRPYPELLSTLSVTLSERCCRSFLAKHPELPLNPRDYHLSKLYQFLHMTLLDEGSDSDYYAGVPSRLEEAIERAFPDRPDIPLNELSRLDWLKVFIDYRTTGLLAIVERLASYVPASTPMRPELQRAKETPAKLIDRLREAKGGWSMEKLAAEAGLDIKQVYRVKRGEGVHTDTLIKLALALDCPPGDLIPPADDVVGPPVTAG